MLRIIAILFGIAFIFIGVAGFFSTFMINGLLFGYFLISPMHNLVHIVTGVLAIMSATHYKLTRYYFVVLGVVYTIGAIVGYWRNGDLFIMQNNMADYILYALVGIVALILGTGIARKSA